MEYYTLQQSLEWVAFGTLDVPFAEQNNQKEKLEVARDCLRQAFLAGKVRVASGNEPLPIKPLYDFDWAQNCIWPFEYPEQYLPLTSGKTDIKVSVRDLEREFPSTTTVPTTLTEHMVSPKQQYQEKEDIKRPGARIPHDVAYYLWEKEQNLSAKEICKIVNDSLMEYPKYKGHTVAKLGTVEKWLTGFRKGTYQPQNKKHILIKQFPAIFDKMRKAHK